MRVDHPQQAFGVVNQGGCITSQQRPDPKFEILPASDTDLKITITMGPHAGISGSSLATVKNETSYKSPPSSVSDLSQHECETVRGRRQDRESTSTAKADDESEDNKEGVDGLPGKPRKRKRSRKGLEKNFPCTFEGCGKSYSRAEHLYRHQLNREMVLVVRCFPAMLTGDRRTEENIQL